MPGCPGGAQVQLSTMRWAMIAHLKRPPHGFEEAVRLHFRLLRARIMRTAARWLAAAAELSGIDQVQAPSTPPPTTTLPSHTHTHTINGGPSDWTSS